MIYFTKYFKKISSRLKSENMSLTKNVERGDCIDG